jgi:hypothetical protein
MAGSVHSHSEAYATEDAPDLYLRDLIAVNNANERSESQAGGSSLSSSSCSHSSRFQNETLSRLQQAVRMTIVNKKIMD